VVTALNKPTVPNPQDERLYLFAIALKVSRFPIIRNIVSLVSLVLLYISPGVPVALHDTLKRIPPRRALLPGILIGLFFCLIVTVSLSVFADTFKGNDPNRIYLSNDWPNIVNYSILCPLYIGLSAHLIALVINGWPNLTNLPFQASKPMELPRRSISFSIFLILGLSIGFTVNYLQECINPAVYPKVGWWVDTIGASGERVLGIVGFYYTILNFTLLFICLTALASFLSMFFLCIRAGKALANELPSSAITFESLRKILTQFTESYLVAKILTAILMLNAYTWKFEKPLASFNMTMMGGALAVFGVFFVSIPRYYIELEWFKYKTRKAIFNGEEPSLHKDDIRPFGTRVAAHIIDLFIVSGFILTFFTWNP
jgi:hypothetical protein